MRCLLCALLRVCVCLELLPRSVLVTSQLCPLSPQRRVVSTAPSRMRMMTAPTTTTWRETPVSSPTPLSVCRRIKVSRGLGGAGDVQPGVWIRVTNSTVPPIPALSLCRAPGQAQLQAAPPSPPCWVGDSVCHMNCKGWSVAPSERPLEIPSPAATGRDCCRVLLSPLAWLGVSRDVIALPDQHFSL